jgi:hypothetical protein
MTLNGSSPNLQTEANITISDQSSPDTSVMAFSEAASLSFKPGGDASIDYSGIIIKVGSATVSQGKIYYLASNGNWSASDKDFEVSSIGLLAFSIGTNSSTDGMMAQGFVTLANAFTIGAPLYLSSAAGNMTNTLPTTTGHFARIVGYAVSGDSIWFCPDRTWVELA